METLIDSLKDPALRKAARAEILRIGQDATPFLVARMRDPEFTIRWEMANVQGSLRDERAVPYLVENALWDVDPHVRWRSMWALGEYPDTTQAVSLFQEALRKDQGRPQWHAAVGLAMLARDDGLSLIHRMVRCGDAWQRWEAIYILGRVHDRTTLAILRETLRSDQVKERSEAVLAIGRIGGEGAVEALTDTLDDPSSEVRWRACMALGSLGDARALPPLRALLKGETDPQVLTHLNAAISKLTCGFTNEVASSHIHVSHGGEKP